MRTNLRDSVKPGMLAPNTKARIVCRNTFRFTAPDGADVIRLHQTDIVRKLPNGKTVLDSGGWRTSTTKERMNSYSGLRLWANKGQWFVSAGTPGESPAVPYYDGMILPDAFDKRAKAP